MPRYPVCRVDELSPGSRKIVDVGGRTIGVFNIEGEYFALLNRCPHEGGELCRGALSGDPSATVPGGEVRFERAGELLRCPWHGWEFDVRTGQSWFDPEKVRVRGYEVQVVEEDGSSTATGKQPGPYVAESYPVTRENAMLVVDTDRKRSVLSRGHRSRAAGVEASR